LLSRVAKQHVAVALSGDGADELFGGYDRYRLAEEAWRVASRVPLPVRAAAAVAVRSLAPQIQWLGRATGLDSAETARSLRAMFRSPNGVADVVGCHSFKQLYRQVVSTWNDDPVIAVGSQSAHADQLLDSDLEFEALGPHAWMMAIDFQTYLHGDILVKVDRASMANSLEVRCPFLDPEVVRFAWSLPDDLRSNGREPKALLRNLARRLVPREVVDRQKMGFGVPLGRWLRGPLRPWMQDLLSRSTLLRHGILDPAPVERSVRRLINGDDAEKSRVWAAVSLTAWAEQWRSG
jgi:asparagine synthase (glutamine-hydrolysing)